MLIAEHFFLIACDPVTGVATLPRGQPDPSLLAAAALTLDLAQQERLHLDADRLRADTRLPLTHPLLNDALHVLGAAEQKVGTALRHIAQKLDPLPQKLLDGLFRRDLLHRIENRDWLLRKRVRYPLRSMQARNEALQQLQMAAHGNDLHGLGLLVLADISGILAVHLKAQDHEAAARRVLALGNGAAHATDTQRLFATIRTALLA
jgi:hypothetical protein